ncbi:MAG: hypothetical protein GY861_14705 [bacterium]|nr:hypothetical protein [bacterium]
MNKKPKIYIATPAFEGKVHVDYCSSLIGTLQILNGAGIEYELGIIAGDCYIAKARNKLAQRFLATDCTHMLFIDADLGWDIEKVEKIILQDYDICLGAYLLKNERNVYPMHLIVDDDGKVIREDDYIRVSMGPTGFMCIKREVFEALQKKSIEYRTQSGKTEWNFFHCDIINDGWMGEDFYFCREAILHDFDVWCYSDMKFNHWGSKKWEGTCKERLPCA